MNCLFFIEYQKNLPYKYSIKFHHQNFLYKENLNLDEGLTQESLLFKSSILDFIKYFVIKYFYFLQNWFKKVISHINNPTKFNSIDN
jgi:hypothetical protein